MGVTVKKCHMIMSGNDCWNSVCFSCCRKADNELASGTDKFHYAIQVADQSCDLVRLQTWSATWIQTYSTLEFGISRTNYLAISEIARASWSATSYLDMSR